MSEDFQMKFVKPKDGSPTPQLLESFHALEEHGLTPEWIEQEQCLQLAVADKNCAYVMDPFEGIAFQHLKFLACRLYGPQCILASLNMKVEMPQKKRPIYNVAMKGVTVSCTSMDKPTRERVHRLVELMAGEASRNLTEGVTHLVAGEVGSDKYNVAADRGLPIMTLAWVEDVWQKATHRYVHALDDCFAGLKCPIFKGVVVTVSGLSPKERGQVKQFVEAEGGTYSGEMKLNQCTHLIVKEPKGQKYDYARKWKVHIVRLQWLYDSLDKNYCQKAKSYPVTGEGASVKTSTPERSRRSAVNPETTISDMSAISVTTLEETTCNGTRLWDASCMGTELNDVTLPAGPIAPFLSGCRLYLSQGIQGPLRKKCQGIMTLAGAQSLDAVCSTVSHVVMEDRVEEEVNIINDMDLRPHVVSTGWLGECCKQQARVSEERFLSPHVMLSEIELPQLKVSTRASIGRKSLSEAGKTRQRSLEESDTTTTAEEDMQLLSQYMDSTTAGTDANSTVQAADEVDGGNTTRLQQDHTDSKSSPHHNQTSQDEEKLKTQGGIFSGKTFTFCGFSEDDTGALADMTRKAGGVVVKAGSRRVADFGVVPILSCAVEQTVGEVVTNAWLQMCLEEKKMLELTDNPVFHPLEVDESKQPLEGCVLSISGYAGTERDCLMHIADILGAICQEFFVRKASKKLAASTHLVVKEATGRKYSSAKDWNVPTVTSGWLFACARAGYKVEERLHNIDGQSPNSTPPPPQQPKALAPAPSTTPHTDAHHDGAATKFEEPSCDTPSTDSDIRKRLFSTDSVPPKAAVELAPPSSSAESRLVDLSQQSVEGVAGSSGSEKGEALDPMGSAKALVHPKAGGLSQKENALGASNRTPLSSGRKASHSRVQELQQQNRKPAQSPGLESPSVFLAPGYRPNFDLKGAFDYLKTPEEMKKKRQSLSLDEVFGYYLAEGVKKSAVPQHVDTSGGSQLSQEEGAAAPLQGVVISVSKKLGVNQTEYNSIVVELGGDYTWRYSNTCTHFIFQGRANDLNKEFRQARSQGKLVVSPYWLFACRDQQCRVEEAKFPHNFNPNLNLGGVVTTETPSGGVRRSARSVTKSAKAPTPASKPQPKPHSPPTAGAWQRSMDAMKQWQTLGNSNSSEARSTTVSSKTVDGSKTDAGSRTVDSGVEDISETDGASKTDASSRTLATASFKTDTVAHSGSKPDDGASWRTVGGNSAKRASVETPGGLAATAAPSSESEEDKSGTSNSRVATDISDAAPPVTEVCEAQCAGSSEIREALSKTLQTVKASSSSKRSSRKKSRRADLNSSGGQLDTSGHMNTSGNLPEAPNQQPAPGAAPSAEHAAEPSQSLQITWDDPTERQEKERQAHKLEMQSVASQDTEDFMANMDMPEQDTTLAPTHRQEEQEDKLDPAPTATPAAPPLAFPAAKCVSTVSKPQPIELISDEETEQRKAGQPVFLMSGMTPQERVEFGEVIERLGGLVLEKQQFDTSCTHLVVLKPSRNEKFLAAVASGLWVLHKSYIIACQREGHFVREEDHEWGSPAMGPLLQTLDAQTLRLVQAAHSWRLRLRNSRQGGECPGAFQAWRVILLTEVKREENFRRLLSAGGATVLNTKPPFSASSALDATHAFVDLNKVKLAEADLEVLARHVTLVLKPDFIAAHLTDHPAPNPLDYIPPGIAMLNDRLDGQEQQPQRGKRKGLQLEDIGSNKRSRR